MDTKCINHAYAIKIQKFELLWVTEKNKITGDVLMIKI